MLEGVLFPIISRFLVHFCYSFVTFVTFRLVVWGKWPIFADE